MQQTHEVADGADEGAAAPSGRPDHDAGGDASLALDDQLCFALYTASRAMTARYRPSLAGLGLSYPQYLVLLALWEEGPMTIGRLGRRLQLGTATLSPLLQRMDDAGLITRARRDEDQRSVLVSTTDRGEGLKERAPDVRVDMCAALGIDADQRGRLIADLHTLVTNLSEHGTEPAG